MACALTQNYTRDCLENFGGVKTVWLMELENADSITLTAGVVTTIDKAVGKVFRKYVLEAHVAEGSEDVAKNRDSGTSAVKQSVKFPINKMTTSVRNELLLLGKNRLLIVLLDNNGKGWLYGYEFGCTLESAAIKTGVKLEDHNGYELTFVGNEKEPAYEVDSTTLGTLETASV